MLDRAPLPIRAPQRELVLAARHPRDAPKGKRPDVASAYQYSGVESSCIEYSVPLVCIVIFNT